LNNSNKATGVYNQYIVWCQSQAQGDWEGSDTKSLTVTVYLLKFSVLLLQHSVCQNASQWTRAHERHRVEG